MGKTLFIVAAYVAIIMVVHSVDRKTSVFAAVAVVASLIGVSSDVSSAVFVVSIVIVLVAGAYAGIKNYKLCGFMLGKIHY